MGAELQASAPDIARLVAAAVEAEQAVQVGVVLCYPCVGGRRVYVCVHVPARLLLLLLPGAKVCLAKACVALLL